MKSKITNFIMNLMVILIILILAFLGLIVYNELTQANVVSEVKDFVSNITISSGGVEDNTNQIQLLEIETNLSEQIENNTNYSSRYFYGQLDSYSKIIYQAIQNNKENMKNGKYEIDLGKQFSDILSNENGESLLGEYYQSAIEAYTYDNPDVFYIDFSKLYLNIETTTRALKKTFRVFINAGNEESYLTNEFSSEEEVKQALDEIEKIQAYFIQNKSEDIYQNIKLVHDYIIQSTEYDQTMSNPNIDNLYGALISKNCVCSGYAKAFKYLMDSLNIPCVIVSGTATDSEGKTENHAWNYVQVGEVWYAVDCTWDDPILIGPGFLSNSSKYRYFLKGAKIFNQSHLPDGQFTENGKVFTYPELDENNY